MAYRTKKKFRLTPFSPITVLTRGEIKITFKTYEQLQRFMANNRKERQNANKSKDDQDN